MRTDLQRFREITFGFPIIMGRNTYFSIGRPLPGRTNLVLSRSSEIDGANSFWQRGDTVLLWVATRESALFFADAISIASGKSDVFVIGGTQMFNLFHKIFNKIYLTEVLTSGALFPLQDDAIFDYKFDRRQWSLTEELAIPAGPNDEFPSKYLVYERKIKTIRFVDTKDYLTDADSKKNWVDNQFKQLDLLKKTKSFCPVKIPYQFDLFNESLQS
jgi:dihydrofolate reductase